jgi:hypothetical protein
MLRKMLTALVSTQASVLCDVTPCSLADTYVPTVRNLPPPTRWRCRVTFHKTDLHMHPRQNLNTPFSLFLSPFIGHRSLMAYFTLRYAILVSESHTAR